MTQKTVPAMRFDGFDDEWGSRDLGSIVSFLRHNSLARADLTTTRTGVQNVHYGDVLIKFGAVLDLASVELPFVRDVSAGGLGDRLVDGDVIFADAAEDSSVGKCCEVRNVGDSVVVPGLHTISVRPSIMFGEGFLGHGLNAETFHDQLVPLMQGAKVSSITGSALASCVLSFPSPPEQRQIGAFLSGLDALIGQHRRKHEQLQQTKVALMQRMFPQADADEPELRVEGFSGAWESQELGGMVSFLRHNSLARADLTTVKTGVQNVHYGDVLVKFGAVLDVSADELPFVKDVSAGGLGDPLRDGDVVFADAAEDFTVGKCCEVRNVGSSHVVPGLHTITVRPNLEFGERFLGYALNADSFHDQLLPLMQGSKVSSISATSLRGCRLSFPSVPEQQAIGAFFSQLDDLISDEQQYINKLQQVKSALLQQMFV